MTTSADNSRTSGVQTDAGGSSPRTALACSTLALLLAFGSFGPLTPAAGRLLLVLALVPLAFDMWGLDLERRAHSGHTRLWRWLAVLLPILPLLLETLASDSGETARVAGVCLGLILWATQTPFLESSSPPAPPVPWRLHLVRALLLSAGIWVLSRHFAGLWLALDAVASGLSAAAALLAGEDLRLGPTVAGLWLALPFLLLALGCLRWPFLPRPEPATAESRRASLSLLLAVPLGLTVYLALQPWLEHLLADGVRTLLVIPEPHRPWNVAPGQLAPLTLLLPWGLFLWFGGRLLSQVPSQVPSEVPSASQASTPAPAHSPWRLWAGGAALVLACLLLLRPASLPPAPDAGGAAEGTGETSGARSTGTPVVAFHNLGHLDFTSPAVGRYGLVQVGMFGAVRRYLESSNYITRELTGELTAEALQGVQVLVVINPQQMYGDGELAALWQWVRGGGGLLALGDHTDIFGIMGPLNQLLAPVSARIEFDSAFALRRHWRHCLDFLPHPITAGMASYHEAQIGTGASLTLSGSALQPLVVGRYGFGDFGNRSNDGQGAFLGDYRYQRGERLGDVVLVAGGRVGQGAVVAFGDTTSLQPLSLPDAYPFVERTVRYLSRPGAAEWPWTLLATILAVGALVLGALVLWRAAPPPWGWTTTSALSLVLAAALTTWLPVARPQVPAPDRLAWIQRGLADRLPREFFQEGAMGGISPMLMRAGYLPLSLDRQDPERLDQASLVLHVAPARPPSAAYLRAVTRLLQRGGTLVVAAGAHGRPAANRLLEACDLRIGNYPLGPAEVELNPSAQTLRFVDAWPVEAGGSVPHTVHVALEGDALIVESRPFEAGRCLVFGDGRFFEDENFEGEFEFQRANVELLDRLLDVGRSVVDTPPLAATASAEDTAPAEEPVPAEDTAPAEEPR